ncbi:hypothetical protein YPPY63_0505, partial [Yersinia pestis PY-63]
MNGEDRQR